MKFRYFVGKTIKGKIIKEYHLLKYRLGLDKRDLMLICCSVFGFDVTNELLQLLGRVLNPVAFQYHAFIYLIPKVFTELGVVLVFVFSTFGPISVVMFKLSRKYVGIH